MSSINRIRYININYNGTSRIVPDLTFNLGGENTVMLMPNGGGKSVLVQMSIAALMSNPKLRNFKGSMNSSDRDGPRRNFDYFMTSPSPTVIMFEWKLDDGGFFLTGAVFRKPVTETGESGAANPVLWQGFTCEYAASCPVDIENIPLIGGTKSAPVFFSRKEMTDTLKELAAKYREEYGFRYYSLNDSVDKARYFSRLESRGVHQREWETIIRTINQEEGGASAYFRNNAVERKLAASILIPTVVEKIDRGGAAIDGFRDAFAKYAANRMENEDAITGAGEKKALLDEMNGSFRTVLTEYVSTYNTRMQRITEAATQMRAVEDYSAAVAENLEAASAQRSANAGLLAETRLKSISLDYYRAKERLAAAESSYSDIKAGIDRLNSEASVAKRKKGRMETARAAAGYISAQAELDRIEGELDALRGENAGAEAEIEQLRKCISAGYTQKISALEQRKKKADRELADNEAETGRLEKERRETEQNAVESGRRLGRMQHSCEAFASAVQHYNSVYGAGYAPGADGVYVMDAEKERKLLASELNGYEADIKSSESGITSARQAKLDAEERAAGIKDSLGEARRKAAAAEQRISDMDKARAVRISVCSVFEEFNPDTDVFSTEKITGLIRNSIRKKELLVREASARLAELELKKERTGRGQLTEMAPEIVSALEEHGISYVPGLKWLADSELSEKDMNSLLDANPLLPYSIIVSRENLDKLKKNERLLPFMSEPILAAVPGDANTPVMAGTAVANFNRLLLKPGAIETETSALDRKIRTEKDFIARRESEKNSLYEELAAIAGDGLTEHGYIAASAEIEEQKTEAERLASALKEAETQCGDASRRLDDLYARRASCREKAERCRLQVSAFTGLIEDYAAYMQDAGKTAAAAEEYGNAVRREAEIDALLLAGKKRAGELAADSSAYSAEIEALSRRREPYFVSGEFPDGNIGKVMERKLADWDGTEKAEGRYGVLTGKVQHRLEETGRRRDEALKAAETKKTELVNLKRRYGISDKDMAYLEPYTPAAFERIESEIGEIEEDMQALLDRQIDASGERRHCQTVLEGIKETLQETADGEPLPESCVEDRDYQEQVRWLEKADRELEQKAAEMERTSYALETLLDAMSQYRLYTSATSASMRLAEEYRQSGDTSKIKASCLAAAEECRKADTLYGDASVMRGKEIDRLSKNHTGSGLGRIIAKLDSDTKNAETAMKNLDGICGYMSALLETENRQAERIKKDLEMTAEAGVGYMESISRELNKIGARSSITVAGIRRKMVSVTAPSKLREDVKLEIEQYLSRKYADCLACRKKNSTGDYREAIDRITTESIYDEVYGFDKIRVNLIKIESGGVRQCSWSEAASQSGGENLFACLSLIFALISYLRTDERDMLSSKSERVPVLLDNIFGLMSAQHLVEPFFELARQNNIQLICYTGLTEKSILAPFTNIYKLELSKAGRKEVMYISDGAGGTEPADYSSKMVAGRIVVGNGEENI